MPHRPRPGTGHALGSNVTFVENFQRRNQLTTVKILTIIVLRQRGQSVDGVIAAHIIAIVGSQAPEMQDYLRLTPERLPRPSQRLHPSLAHSSPLGRLCRGNTLIDILLDSLGKR